ncbi:MAG: hypothetical protein ACREP9_13980, partial [Candidatus Dormibacteraceae bacterium]
MNDRVPGTANRKQGLGLRLTTLYLGPALLLTAIVLPTLLLWNHLQFDSYSWLVVLFGPTFASGWIAFVILSLVIRQTARPMLWESYLQLLYVFG